MTTTNPAADRHTHAVALTTEGLDGLAGAAQMVDLRAVVAYASDLLVDGTALAVAPADGWLMELALALGRVPTALEVEARRAGAWWATLGHAYERDGRDGLLAWGVPADLLRSVEAELLEDLVGGAWDSVVANA